MINTCFAASRHCTNTSSLCTVTLRTGYSPTSANTCFTYIGTTRHVETGFNLKYFKKASLLILPSLLVLTFIYSSYKFSVG